MKRHLVHALVLGSALSVAGWSPSANAQVAAAKPSKKHGDAAVADHAASVTRAYDIADLVLIVHDHPRSGPLVPPTKVSFGNPNSSTVAVNTNTPGGGVQTPFFPNSGQPEPAHPQSPVDQLKSLITGAVDPNSWKENGGSTGSIVPLNGELFITQTPENQTAVSNLLDQLRKARARMVRVRADWVLLGRGEINKLLKNGAADTSALPEVNRAALAALGSSVVHYSGQIACFSGQTVHIASGPAENIVTAITPVVAPGVSAMQPSTEYVHYGLSLEVCPTAAAGSVTLDLSSVVSDAVKIPPTPAPSTQPTAVSLDRLNNVIQNFHTTVQMPANTPVLVAGTTADPATDQPTGKELYLIVEADTGK